MPNVIELNVAPAAMLFSVDSRAAPNEPNTRSSTAAALPVGATFPCQLRGLALLSLAAPVQMKLAGARRVSSSSHRSDGKGRARDCLRVVQPVHRRLRAE